MRTYPECYGCVLQQAQSEMDLLGVDYATQTNAVKQMLRILSDSSSAESPPYLSYQIHKVLRDLPGYLDPYLEAKRKSNQIALRFLENLRVLINEGEDPLEQGLKIGATGNIVDVINAREYHLWDEVEKAVHQELLGGGLENFRSTLSKASHILYLADNAGETVFDRAFIETLEVPVIYAVKGGSILNDAMREDALESGVDQVADIVDTGSNAPGTILELCSEDFQSLFREAPLVLAKGQANYETIENQGEKVFYLLRMKCPLLSEVIGVPHGSLVLKQADRAI